MGKTIFCNIRFLAFLSLLFFNSTFVFTEAKVVAPNRNEVMTQSSYAKGSSITVYNQNRALIKEKHLFDLNKGINHLDWSNLASTIDVYSVSLSSVNADQPIEVKEQSYLNDLISARAILNRSVGKSIFLRRYFNSGLTEVQVGVLLGDQSSSERVVKIGDRYLLNPEGQIEVSEIPSGLVVQPKLSFVVRALESGKKNLLLTYEATNINWQCDYNLLLNNDQNKFDLIGLVTLTNQCGLGFKNLNLKLIAGNVQAIGAPMSFKKGNSINSASMQGQAFADYHLYTFPETVDIDNNETKRLTLMATKAIPVVKKYIFDQQYYMRTPPKQKIPVQIKLEFQNDEKNEQPLPAGVVRIYQEDTDNDVQLVGEDRIVHTAVGEKISIKLGDAFDVLGERICINTEQIAKDHRQDTYKVTFNNHLDKDVMVTDIEHVPDLAVFNSESPFSKVNSDTFQFDVKVPANSTADVSYTLVSKF